MAGDNLSGRFKKRYQAIKETSVRSPKIKGLKPKASSPSESSRDTSSDSKSKDYPGLPIPQGDTPYALAKKAEYKDRDQAMAEFYYKQAINEGDRIESAVKDLASLLHQRGKTAEACKLLETYKYLFMDNLEKYQNLYNTLQKQMDEASSTLSRILKVSGLSSKDENPKILALFNNSSRILSIQLDQELEEGRLNYFALLRFNSHSSARKTLEFFRSWDRYRIEWVSKDGDVLGDAHYARHKMEEHRKINPTFDYMIFERDPKGYVLSLPIDGYTVNIKEDFDEKEYIAEDLLGRELYSSLFDFFQCF